MSLSTFALPGLPGCFFSPPECELCGDPRDDVCIPAEGLGPPPDACGKFVSSGADTGGDGTKSRPFRSLADAFAAAAPGAGVYACGEVFQEAITVPAGARLYGGLDCEQGFRYAPDAARTQIAPPSGTVALRLGPGDEETHVVDVRVVGPPASEPGGSSIAALVDRARVVFVRTTLVALDGADGADGAPHEAAASAGEDGVPGGDACSDVTVPGGFAVLGTCRHGWSMGGRGGDGTTTLGEDGEDGTPWAFVNHGQGQLAIDPPVRCSPGWAGDDGDDGEPGLGGGLDTHGSLGPRGYLGVNGLDGAPGAPAQGGGGGGGARGGTGVWACAGLDTGGASGGSGGTGGCGGLGGRGGKAGGASIALVSLSSSLVLERVTLVANHGGRGGDGGPGQLGGPGGEGAIGGSAQLPLLPGCSGGRGGHGGAGGRGGGGAGGHSVGVAFTGAPFTLAGVDISVNAAGKGGLGDGETGPGSEGVSGATLDMNP